MYVALYGPKGSVIFDHPYNAESERDTDGAGLLVLHADHRFGACPALLRHPIFVCTTFPLGTLGLNGSAARAVPV